MKELDTIQEAKAFGYDPADLLLWVDSERQLLLILRGEDGSTLRTYPISTAILGLGEREHSYQTPRGWHRVCERYGADMPIGTAFESRVAVEGPAESDFQQTGSSDLILTRILRLEGLEAGKNKGDCASSAAICDSYARYIYLHGTHQEQLLGQPASKGCIRMANADILELFDLARNREIYCLIE